MTSILEQIRKMDRENFRGDSNVWRPTEKDEVLTGIIVEIKRVSGNFGDQIRVVVKTADGDKVFYANKMAADQLVTQKARASDTIAVRYFGKERLRNGNSMNAYGILIEHKGTDNDVEF